jgi:hypothetical protein
VEAGRAPRSRVRTRATATLASMSEPVDIGHGFSYRTFTERGATESTGLIISGPAGPNCHHKGVSAGADDEEQCAGGCHFSNSGIAQREGRPMWTVEQREPLTISPSIRCACGDQHGFLRNGRYEPC